MYDDDGIELFRYFQKLEHALIMGGFARSRNKRDYDEGRITQVEVDWSLFDEYLDNFFDETSCKEEVRILLDQPPSELSTRNDWPKAKFVSKTKPTTTSSLLAAARRVRNNLFHGSKLDPDYARNSELCRAAKCLMALAVDHARNLRGDCRVAEDRRLKLKDFIEEFQSL